MRTVSPGIRQKENGKYVATKYVGSKRFYKEFDKEKDALKWKKNFHPLLEKPIYRNKTIPTASDQSNGKDKVINFGEVLERYQKSFLRTLQAYTQYKKMQRLAKFTPNLFSVPMCAMSPDLITNHIDSILLTVGNESRRCNFDKELKDLSSIFNWYKGVDFTFVNPIQGLHYKIGTIQETPDKSKDLDAEELDLFLSKLSPMFRSMAVIMYLWGLRIGEAAALSDDVVNFKKREALIYNVMVWLRGRPEIKKGTKTGRDAKMPIIDEIEVELKTLQKSRPQGCKYFFHHKGKPLRYAMILKEFNRALKDAGLPYSGTHIMRHTAATLTRKTLGLDYSQAIMRHTTARMTEGYAKLDVGEKVNSVVIQLSDHLKKSATNRDQRALSG